MCKPLVLFFNRKKHSCSFNAKIDTKLSCIALQSLRLKKTGKQIIFKCMH